MCKCDTCQIEMQIRESKEPACCVWYMDHVVIAGESVENCTAYAPVK